MKKSRLSQYIRASLCSIPLISASVLAENIIINSTFDKDDVAWDLPAWWNSQQGGYGGEAWVDSLNGDKRVCAKTNKAATDDSKVANWTAQLRQGSLTFVKGNQYTVSFDVWSTTDFSLEADVTDGKVEYASIFNEVVSVEASSLTGKPKSHQFTVEALRDSSEDNSEVYFALKMGGGVLPLGEEVCFDNIVIEDPNYVAPVIPSRQRIMVNQHGYLPNLVKQASFLVNESSYSKAIVDSIPGSPDTKTPRNWRLMSGTKEVLAGKTVPFGLQDGSGDTLHTIDFSSVKTEGDNYSLVVEEKGEEIVSPTFEISKDLYQDLKYEALSYFYHNRSGEDILSSVVGSEYARAAGHENDDQAEYISCHVNIERENLVKEDVIGCVTIDASKGWYDAGDFGKYVVNGGISVWTMMNQYERTVKFGAKDDAFDDGTMMLPRAEKSNDVPDILDEARVEMEFILNMQVADGLDLAGMAYHKMHGLGWDALPLLPEDSDRKRIVTPPSTAATLNLAATGAQCARLFEDYDSAFADECLIAAEKAYRAAKANPNIEAINYGDGGGMYGDGYFGDEFYWAAAELYATTGDQDYLDDMEASDHHLNLLNDDGEIPGGLIGWNSTAVAGMISLVTTDVKIDSDIRNKAQDQLLLAADHYAALSQESGFGLPVPDNYAYWGSNSGIVNNMIILGIANDIEEKVEYMNALQGGMSYLLGRNPMAISYITGYGEKAAQNPHHRFWANQPNNGFPMVPAGVLVGGPNEGLEDENSKRRLDGCDPLVCYWDNINSYATNEITVNWNAPLAWALAYMDDISGSTVDGTKDVIIPENDEDKDDEVIEDSEKENTDDSSKDDTEKETDSNNGGTSNGGSSLGGGYNFSQSSSSGGGVFGFLGLFAIAALSIARRKSV